MVVEDCRLRVSVTDELLSSASTMALNVPGVIVMVIFYLMVLGTGVWASFKSRRKQKRSGASAMEMTLLGNRSINLLVGIFTMTGEAGGDGSLVIHSHHY